MPDLLFDTETTGLPPRGETDFRKYPYMIQLAAKLVDGPRIIAQFSFFTFAWDEKGELVPIPKEPFFLEQGYTDDFIAQNAYNPLIALAALMRLSGKANRWIAHNAQFDIRIVLAAIHRYCDEEQKAKFRISDLPPIFCTKETLTSVCKLPGKFPGKYKWPSLDEAYRHMVDPAGFSGAHDAMNDVSALHTIVLACESNSIPLTQVTI